MSATIPGHALFNLDRILVAFFNQASGVFDFSGYAGQPVQIVPGKYDLEKELPLVICKTDTSDRGRAKNWTATGRIIVRTPLLNDQGLTLEDESSALEFAVIAALENIVPIDDNPQPLCDAINAIATANDFDDFILTNFMIKGIESDDEDEFWQFTINFTATVLNDSYNNT